MILDYNQERVKTLKTCFDHSTAGLFLLQFQEVDCFWVQTPKIEIINQEKMESRACGRLINTWSTAVALLQISVSNFYVELMKTMGTCVINAETYHRVHSIYYVLTDPNLIQYVNGGLYVHFELSEIKPFLCLW